MSGSSERVFSTSSFRPNRRIVTWKGSGRPSGRSAMTSPSRISSRAGQSANQRHDFGHGVGDVAKASRKDPDNVLRLVDLHPRAIQLVLERRVVQPVERVLDAGFGLREHRLDRPHHLHRDDIERRLPAGERRSRHRLRDRRPSSPRAGDVAARPSRRARRLPAAHPRARPGEARRRAAGEGSRVRPLSRARTSARSTRARSPADPLPETRDSVANASSTSPNVQRRFVCGRRVRRRRNGRVSDADPALPGRARQKRDGRLDLVGLEPCEQIREPVDLVQPAADARDISRRRHEINEAHEEILMQSRGAK